MTTTQEMLEAVEKKFKFVPNMMQEMAKHAPTVVDYYLKGADALSKGTLSTQEQQAVFLAISAINECHYCTASHASALKRMGMPEQEIQAINVGSGVSEPRLNALLKAASLVTKKHGWLTPEEILTLEKAGVSRGDLYQVVGLLGLKVVTNYFNHIAATPLDKAFEAGQALLAGAERKAEEQCCSCC